MPYKDPALRQAARQKWLDAHPGYLRQYEARRKAADPEGFAEAHARYNKAWYERNKGKATAAARRWNTQNRDRMLIIKLAGEQVRKAVKSGALVRPDVCENCGQQSARIEAAHKDYSKPLDVQWLCRPCHVRTDRKSPRSGG